MMSRRDFLCTAALAVLLTVVTVNAEGVNRKLLQGANTASANPATTTTPNPDKTQAAPQSGNSGPDSWQYWGGGGRIWQRPGWGRDWWNMQSQSQSQAQVQAAAVPAQTATAQPVNDQAAPQEAATAAGGGGGVAQTAGSTAP